MMTNDGRNLVGPWIIEVRESEYESFIGSKVKKHRFKKPLIVINDDGKMV